MAENVLNDLKASDIFDLKGVVAVVTGGGSGIGLMIATTLLANGATVYIIGPEIKDLDRIAHMYDDAAQKTPGRGRIYGLQGDIRLKSEAKRLAEEVARREKYITVLFNNAGIATGSFKRPDVATAEAYVSSLFDGVLQKAFDDVYRTNAVGPYWLTIAFLPLLEKWKNSDEPVTKRFVPQVIMTSSMNGWTKDAKTGGYSFPYLFSKSALGHATASLAHELLPLGIRVNGIAPGLFATNMTTVGATNELGIAKFDEDPGLFEIPTVPTGGTIRDMGSLTLFLVANWFVNGETVLIDGGTLLKHPSSY